MGVALFIIGLVGTLTLMGLGYALAWRLVYWVELLMLKEEDRSEPTNAQLKSDTPYSSGWEQPPRVAALCIACSEPFPGVEPPAKGTLYCHTACFSKLSHQ